MAADEPTTSHTSKSLARIVAALVVPAVGWFFMSWLVMGSAPADAVGEAVGVAFGMLILVSVVGSFRNLAAATRRADSQKTDELAHTAPARRQDDETGS